MDPELINLFNELILSSSNKEYHMSKFEQIVKNIKSRNCSLCGRNLNYYEYKYNVDNGLCLYYNIGSFINNNNLICSNHWCKCMPTCLPSKGISVCNVHGYVCKDCGHNNCSEYNYKCQNFEYN